MFNQSSIESIIERATFSLLLIGNQLNSAFESALAANSDINKPHYHPLPLAINGWTRYLILSRNPPGQ